MDWGSTKDRGRAPGAYPFWETWAIDMMVSPPYGTWRFGQLPRNTSDHLIAVLQQLRELPETSQHFCRAPQMPAVVHMHGNL